MTTRLHRGDLPDLSRYGREVAIDTETMGLDPRRDTLFGIYQGVPLPERSALDPPLLPDKITIFSESLRENFPDLEELRAQIRLTVLHEIAHYFGMDEEQIEELGY